MGFNSGFKGLIMSRDVEHVVWVGYECMCSYRYVDELKVTDYV